MTFAVPLIEITRGDTVESVHLGAVAVWSAGGLNCAIGDVEAPVFPRSAIKPVQALQLIMTGAAEKQRLSGQQLALACASHNGGVQPVGLVRDWLSSLDLTEQDLRCGKQLPDDPMIAGKMFEDGVAPSQLHNNCSGKHVGFLTVAKILGEDLPSYLAAEHPVQRRWLEDLGYLAGTDLSALPMGIDGCGIPTYAMPLKLLAKVWCGLGADTGRYAPAAGQLIAMMATYPELVAGPELYCSRIMATTGGAVIAKVGAEGVYAACIPARGLGVALKIWDGSYRAASLAVATVLHHLLAKTDRAAALAPLMIRGVYDRRGNQVGVMRPTQEFIATLCQAPV